MIFVPRPVYLTTYMMDEQTRPIRVVNALPSARVRKSIDLPDEICDLRRAAWAEARAEQADDAVRRVFDGASAYTAP